jgi:hypothetical protein
MAHWTRFAPIALLSVASFAACEKRQPPAKRQLAENNLAINRIVQARCEREARCTNIGQDKKFSSREVCSTELMEKSRSQLNKEKCPAGVDSKELGECIRQIKEESCGNPIDTLERVAACNPMDLCVSKR